MQSDFPSPPGPLRAGPSAQQVQQGQRAAWGRADPMPAAAWHHGLSPHLSKEASPRPFRHQGCIWGMKLPEGLVIGLWGPRQCADCLQRSQGRGWRTGIQHGQDSPWWCRGGESAQGLAALESHVPGAVCITISLALPGWQQFWTNTRTVSKA